ncbi:hypothetical protein [Streptomyces sp. C1-2]|uniref:hypothetical protein n=1 Tax=Streptomyces sp. C1-2 TaxID=2720022 RepID=UPI0019D2BB1D|nr:hypothetical protein [Streptomyces sp. C1-2]
MAHEVRTAHIPTEPVDLTDVITVPLTSPLRARQTYTTPVAALLKRAHHRMLAADFRLHAPAPPDQADPDTTIAATAGGEQVDQTREAAELRAERQRHEHELAEERHVCALAEEEARHFAERLQDRAAHISDLQRALAALTPTPGRVAITQPTVLAASVPAPSRPQPPPGSTATAQTQGQRWWPRRG